MRYIKPRKVIMALMLIFGFSQPALAVVIDFSGRVTQVANNSGASFISMGTTFSGHYVYDTSLANTSGQDAMEAVKIPAEANISFIVLLDTLMTVLQTCGFCVI